MMKSLTALLIAVPLGAAFAFDEPDITIIGEVHDNPAHQATHARIVRMVQPQAIVWEMLTPEQAARVTPEGVKDAAALGETLEWDASGWPDFSHYYPVFAAAPDALTYGAGVPRAVAYGVVEGDLATAFAEATRYGLDKDLDTNEQAARQALQFAAHCEALPEETLPGMVNVQRLRDATLAQTALRAFAETGGPVVIITGNGHARKDWGVPRYLARVAPEVAVYVIGQSEDGVPPQGGFDDVLDAQGIARPDPCAAFK